MVGVAVNVTEVPAHTVAEGLAAIDTEAAAVEFTTMAIPELVAVAGLAQLALLVKTHVTI